MPKGIYNRLESQPRKSCSEITKAKISKGNKGKIRSEEVRRKDIL